MTQAENLAEFAVRASFEALSEGARNQVKIHVLDALGCAIGALLGGPVRALREQIEDFDGSGHCTLIGGGRSAPDRAAMFNSALVRYLDFNDSYLAKGETCHPSDNLGAVLAAAEYAGLTGKDFMASLALAYQVQCRLSDVAPVRSKGFDHTAEGAFAVAAAVSRALGLDRKRTANAIAICGTAFNALRVSRTGGLSNWKGLAYPNLAFGCTHSAFLAMRGVTGPLEVFEGNKGFMDSISGPFQMDWSREDLERITGTILKRFNAEIHSQSALEGILELREEFGLTGPEVEQIRLEIFDVAYHIIGGGEEGDKKAVQTKEEADHSLPYLLAVALLDGRVMPEQYEAERINRPDVQNLLIRVTVLPSKDYSAAFPAEMPCRLTLTLRDGRVLEKEKKDYEGFLTRPMRWDTVLQKFNLLSARFADESLRREIAGAVARLEEIRVGELMKLLAEVRIPNA